MKTRYKKGDIVLAKSIAGDVILPVHHKLVERVVVEPQAGQRVGFKKSMDWPGYAGWETFLVSAEEVEYLKKEWNIPFTEPEKELTFVYDSCILKKVREVKVSQKILNKLKSRKKIKRGRNGKTKEKSPNPPERKNTRVRRGKSRRKKVGSNSG